MAESRKRITGLRYLYILAVMFGIGLMAYVVFAVDESSKPAKHITFISSYKSDNPREAEFIKMYEAAMGKEGFNCEIFQVYLDGTSPETDLNSQVAQVEAALAREADLVLLNDDLALDAFLHSKDKKAHTLPAVFSGVSYINCHIPGLATHKNITGAWDKMDFDNNVKYIEAICGNHVPIVMYIDPEDLRGFDELKTAVAEGSSVKLNEYFLHSQEPNNAAFGSDSVLQKVVERFELDEIEMPYSVITPYFSKTVNNNEDVPVSPVDNQFNGAMLNIDFNSKTLYKGFSFNGFPFSATNEPMQFWNSYFGGYMTTLSDQANDAAKLSARIFRGESPEAIAYIFSEQHFVVDWTKVLWEESNYNSFPKETVFLNMPFSARYRVEISILIAILSLVVFLALVYLLTEVIGERRRSQMVINQLKHNEQEMSLVLQGTSNFIWSVRDGVLYSHNLCTDLKVEYPLEQIYNFSHPEDVKGFEKDVDDAMTLPLEMLQQVVRRYRTLFSTLDYAWWEFRYMVSEDENGNREMHGLASYIQDTVDEELELRDKAIQLDLSIRGSVAFVWRLTNVGIFTMINPRTGEAICEESLGSLSDIWVETSQKANFVREFTNAISDKGYGLGFHSFRVKALDRDGEYCWWEMRYNISEENERRVANGFTFSVQNEMSREESLIVAKNKSDRINAVVQEMMGPIKSLTKSGSLLKSGGLSNEQELAEIENIDKNIEMLKGLSEHIQSISEGEA